MAEQDGYQSFLSDLETERLGFVHLEADLPSRLKQFQRWSAIFREDLESLKLSRAQKSVRKRSQALLKDVFDGLGLEVFVLITLATTMTKLTSMDNLIVIPLLKQWWAGVAHPETLASFAATLDKMYGVETLLAKSATNGHAVARVNTTARKHRRRRMQELSGTRSHQHPSEPTLNVTPGCRVAGCSYLNISAGGDMAIRQTEDGSAELQSTAPHLEPGEELGTVVDLELGVLLNFLQQNGFGGIKGRVHCAYGGLPLPYFDIHDGSVGLGGKLEFSHALLDALLGWLTTVNCLRDGSTGQ